ncbi:MAG: LysE family transporter [Planctomycetota bacterium]|jgi:threonine/homoserine/homoserine lactone efflux protein
MPELLAFLTKAVVISLSGVMAPGALTAATIASGTRRWWAGPMVAAGHGIVELPLIVLIVLGMDRLLEVTGVQIGIGLAGGAFMLLMAFGMFRSARRLERAGVPQGAATRHPLAIGIILSASNPYFLLWWATVGLALAVEAVSLGIMAFVLFAIIHWSLDLIWLTILSTVTFAGGHMFGDRVQRIILGVCGAALLLFGVKFLWDAGATMVGMLQPAY